MPDPKSNETPEPDAQDAPTTEPSDQEKAFWQKLDERIDAGLQRGVEKFMPKKPKGGEPGTSRNGGRTTLPGIFADFMGGPFSRDKQD